MTDSKDISAVSAPNDSAMDVFRSPVLDRLRASREPNVWRLPKGELLLPRVFGFCRGVNRALTLASRAAERHGREAQAGRLVLLGEIIHHPWVNEYFQRRGARLLSRAERENVAAHVTREDTAIIPAFGVPPSLEHRLRAVGCRIIDCTCPDVRRLWTWSEQAARDGYGVVIFGRSEHDETVVTKSRLAAAGGAFLVLETLRQVGQFGRLLQSEAGEREFRSAFLPTATNAPGLSAFDRLAQVSQTTMLYDETRRVREILSSAFVARFGREEADRRLRFQPTVCRATQDRQDAAVELCRTGCDLVIVVGGFGSSNTRHLHELALRYAPAYLIEDARSIRSPDELLAYDRVADRAAVLRQWLPSRRPLRIGLLAGASSPEIVVGEVLQRLAEFLERAP